MAGLGQASCGDVHTWSCSEVNGLRYFTAHTRGSSMECGGHESTHLLQLQSSGVLATLWCIESPLLMKYVINWVQPGHIWEKILSVKTSLSKAGERHLYKKKQTLV